ncbi:glyoxylase-like metal-dependent hydrolase (beta-lactamase superfamily II) [Phycicoccus badiiscoriae]|uniref:Glyoxylase-like metal-dependent hydrolase (Beta-lactamase superfamily II) n=1 Tax=Pedococcus badiiscoriae TaxID=642776 RepID=A0A852WD66_9MICO|nr:MBL fold metallo-hydrolase [Pedococcus badiiscoriae]NYG06640.1 glyoxylase-like metal-dependent hydrolase (beta-lactamase superfamily II) [Pedococcus badiiscoriae]
MTPAQAPAPSAAFGDWHGGQVTARALCVLCPNPSPMTLDGTNTWVLLEPGSTEAIVIDPGPLDEGHLQSVLRAVSARGARVAQTILTHGHADHAEGAGRFAELSGAPTRAVGRGHDDLAHGDVVTAGGLELRVVATPGHTSDSLSFALAADHALLTGDTVLGRGTTVVAHPDGELAAYLASLERIAHLTGDGEVTAILPGHGPVVPDAAAMVAFYRLHRAERLEQVRQALADGAAAAPDVVQAVVERVYADVPREVWPAAAMSVAAQLDYLSARS